MSDANTKVATLPAIQQGGDMLTNPFLFEHMQRVAKVFCASALVPDHLKKNNGADAFLALHIARQRGEDPVAVMQNIYFVSGKAGWLTTYMISRANKSGAFKGRIKWRTTGKGEEMEVTAYAIAADDGTECSATVSMAMAIGEGWARNAKYKTMQEHMLKWRSATMLIRLYCPEVMSGMRTADELEDMDDVTAYGSATTAPPEPKRSDFLHKPEVEDDTPTNAETETWELFDEVGEMVGEWQAAEWTRRLAHMANGKISDKELGQLLENNDETAKLVCASDDSVVETLRALYTPAEPVEDKPQPRNWKVVSTVPGEAALIKDITDLLDMDDADVPEILKQNSDRLGKMSMQKRGNIERHAEARLAALKGA